MFGVVPVRISTVGLDLSDRDFFLIGEAMFTVAMILYGNHFDLAKRLLSSLENSDHVQDFRIGLNDVCKQTLDYAHDWAGRQFLSGTPTTIYQELAGLNVAKYPLMRTMMTHRPLAERLMWFDDDSFLDPSCQNNLNANGKVEWWDRAEELSRGKHQVGSVHMIMQRKKQYEMIKQQSWYANKVVNSRHRFKFATGGWWIAESSILTKWDYPWADLYHNGGDSMLGELFRQRGLNITSVDPLLAQCLCESCSKRMRFTFGVLPLVHINHGGRKGRRGIGTSNERYLWESGKISDKKHQNFKVKASCYEI